MAEVRVRKKSGPTRCGSEREEDSKSQNKNVQRRSDQEQLRLDNIQEKEIKNMKREQEKLRQEFRSKLTITPSVDTYLYHQMGKKIGLRQKEYDHIARRAEVQRRTLLDQENFAREDDDLDSWEEEEEANGLATT